LAGIYYQEYNGRNISGGNFWKEYLREKVLAGKLQEEHIGRNIRGGIYQGKMAHSLSNNSKLPQHREKEN
jgi:hypothetical protein